MEFAEGSREVLEVGGADVAAVEPVEGFGGVGGSEDGGVWEGIGEGEDDALGAAAVGEPVVDDGDFWFLAGWGFWHLRLL